MSRPLSGRRLSGRPLSGHKLNGRGQSMPGTALAPRIVLSASTVADNASVGAAVGTASAPGTTGTATWSLTNSAGGKYAINSSTGAVTVAGALTAGTDTITIAVSGLTPSVANASFAITVTASAAGPSLDFSQSSNSQYVPII